MKGNMTEIIIQLPELGSWRINASFASYCSNMHLQRAREWRKRAALATRPQFKSLATNKARSFRRLARMEREKQVKYLATWASIALTIGIRLIYYIPCR